MNTWFTSDTHFGHANIIKYCSRPFIQDGDLNYRDDWRTTQIANARANEMDEVLIKNWNSKIGLKDTVYHLGDFAFCEAWLISKYLDRLHFKNMYFLWGNHDRSMETYFKKGKYGPAFKIIGDLAEIKVNGQNIVLCHYAMRVWNKSHHGSWHLYGHSHGTLPDDPNALSMDVGVDTNSYFPYSFEDVAQRMAKKTFKPVDHHGKTDR